MKVRQDHGFSRPLFRKPRRRRWPWVVVVAAIGAFTWINFPDLSKHSGDIGALTSLLTAEPSSTPESSPVAVPVAVTTATPEATAWVPAAEPATVTDMAAVTPEASNAGNDEPATDVTTAAVTTADAESGSAVDHPPESSSPTVTDPLPDVSASDLSASDMTAPVEVEPATVTVASVSAEPAPQIAGTQTPSEAVASIDGAATSADAETASRAVADASRVVSPSISRAVLTTGVSDREPMTPVDTARPMQIAEPTAFFYFTEINDLNGGEISHRWYHDGSLVNERDIKVGAIRWRTWSRQVLDGMSAGHWRVEVVAADGEILAHEDWQVTGATP